MLSGPAGVGKTALRRWAVAEAGAAGALVLHASGTEAVLPYGGLERLLRPLASSRRLVPEMSEESQQEPVDELAITGAVAGHLLSAARRALLAIFLDDVEGIDSGSQRVLEEVLTSFDDAGATGAVHCFTVLAAREPGPDAPLALRALRLGNARAIPLGGLDEHDVYELLLDAGVPPNPRMVADLLDQTGGLPLLLEPAIERLAAPPAAGAIAPSVRPRVKTVTDALAPRFEKVDEATRTLLAAATVLEQPWTGERLAALTGRRVAEVDDALRAASAARLVLRADSGWRFDHPTVRAELQHSMTVQGRRGLHRAAAAALLAADDVPVEDLLRAGDHLADAGPAAAPGEVADVCWRAGQVAAGSNAPELAARLFSAAADAAAGEGRLSPTERAERHLRAARAAYLANDGEECERHLQVVLAAADVPSMLRLSAAAILIRKRLAKEPLRHGRRPRVQELESALAATDLDPRTAVEGRAILAEALFVSGESDRALALVAAARGDSRDDPRSEITGRIEFAEGLHHMAALELGRALACFERAIEAAQAADVPLLGVSARARQGFVLVLLGSLPEADEKLRRAEALAEAHRFWGEASYALAVQAHLAAVGGSSHAALLLDRARRLHRRSGYAYSGLIIGPVSAAISARNGRDRGPDALDDNGSDHRSSAVRALTAAESGDAVAAQAVLGGSRWRHGFTGPLRLSGLAVAVALVEVGDLLERPDLLRAAKAPLVQADELGVTVANGWPALVPRLLATVARHDGRADDARRHLDHADAVCDSFHLPAEAARVQLERAALELQGGGDRDDASALAAAAIGTFDELGMHGWVRRAEALAERNRLPPGAQAGHRARPRTILTTDIVASTSVNVRLGDALYFEQLRTHDRIVRARLAEFGGVEIKHTGDGINAFFERSPSAIRCALAIQDDLAGWARDEPELALEIRCGLARGRVIPSGGDLFGVVQSMAARICAAAAGGEVLASAEAVADGCPPEVGQRSLGFRELRGLDVAVELYRLTC